MEKKYLSLTFDDGPNLEGDDTMEKMLDILEKHEVKATFFLIGNKISEKNSPVIKRAFSMGCDIQNHSWSHFDMTTLSAKKIIEEYEKTDDAIMKITGKRPKFFRPPYISVNSLMFETIKTPFICAHGCRDWEENISVDERLHLMLEDENVPLEDGLMFLLHVSEKNDKTLEVVDRAIPFLKNQGFSFATVTELFEMKNIPKKNNGKLWTVVK